MSKKKRDIYDIDPQTAKSMLMEDDMSSFALIVKNDIDNSSVLDDCESNDDFFYNLGKMIETKHNSDCDYVGKENIKTSIYNPDDAIKVHSVFTTSGEPRLFIDKDDDSGITIQLNRLITDDDDTDRITDDYIAFSNQLMRSVMISILPSLKPSAVFNISEINDTIRFFNVDNYDKDSFVFYRYDESKVLAYALSDNFWDAIEEAAKYAIMHNSIMSLIQSMYDISKMNGVHFAYFTPYHEISTMLIKDEEETNRQAFNELFYKSDGVERNETSTSSSDEVDAVSKLGMYHIDFTDRSICRIVSAARDVFRELIDFEIGDYDDNDYEEENNLYHDDTLFPSSLNEIDDGSMDIPKVTENDNDMNQSIFLNGQPIKFDEVGDFQDNIIEEPIAESNEFDSLMDDIDEDDSEKLEDQYFGNIQPRVTPIKKTMNKNNNDDTMIISRRK